MMYNAKQASRMIAIMTFSFMFMLVTSTQGVITAMIIPNQVGSETTFTDNDYLLSYTSHAPIVIDEETDFLVFPGNGSAADPYRIENLMIESTNGSSCINIRDVSVNFVISNCSLSGSRGQNEGAIEVSTAHFGNVMQTIINCEISNSSTGILLQDLNMTIVDCTFILEDTEYVDRGIHIRSSEGINIVDCTFIGDGEESAIYTPTSNGIKITGCIFEDVESFVGGAYSPWLGESPPEFLISENTFRKDSSIKLDINSTVISNYFVDFDRSGTGPFALIVSNYVCDIYENIFENCTSGAKIDGDGSRLHNNTFSQCTSSGALIVGSDCIVTNNTFSSCYVGIHVNVFSTNNHIYYNTFVNNEISAEDYGSLNIWDDSVSMGNLWDDHPPTHEGVYAIGGTAESIDRWPVFIGDVVRSQDDTIIIIAISSAIIITLIVIVLAKKRFS